MLSPIVFIIVPIFNSSGVLGNTFAIASIVVITTEFIHPYGSFNKPKNISKEAQNQAQEDEPFQNTIEGKFGQAKIRFSLNLVMKKMKKSLFIEQLRLYSSRMIQSQFLNQDGRCTI